MTRAAIDVPQDAVLGVVPRLLEPETVLAACRAGLDRVEPAAREAWTEARFMEALYHPGRYLRVVYALLDDPATPNERLWPEGQLVYLSAPVRRPMSRRGTLLDVGGEEVEAYRFPNDRRLRGLRKFAHKRSATEQWQQWIERSGSDVRLNADSLQRLYYRYVPEQKWIVRLRAEVVGDPKTKQRVAVRSGAPELCEALAKRHTAAAKGCGDPANHFRIPKVVGLEAADGMLAVEWLRGESLLSVLTEQGEQQVMPSMAARLGAFHRLGVADLPTVTVQQLAEGAREAVDDLVRVCSDLAEPAGAVATELARRLGELEPVEPVTLHNDFHWNQVSIKPHRWTLLDLERMALGDPLMDVAHFATQVLMLADRPEFAIESSTARRWASAFLEPWAEGLAGAIDPERFCCYAALSRLQLARGMMRHLRPGWRALATVCVRRCREDLRGDSIEGLLP